MLFYCERKKIIPWLLSNADMFKRTGRLILAIPRLLSTCQGFRVGAGVGTLCSGRPIGDQIPVQLKLKEGKRKKDNWRRKSKRKKKKKLRQKKVK
jgi:hypothetical protein